MQDICFVVLIVVVLIGFIFLLRLENKLYKSRIESVISATYMYDAIGSYYDNLLIGLAERGGKNE